MGYTPRLVDVLLEEIRQKLGTTRKKNHRVLTTDRFVLYGEKSFILVSSGGERGFRCRLRRS